jgi:hypothetical protein
MQQQHSSESSKALFALKPDVAADVIARNDKRGKRSENKQSN